MIIRDDNNSDKVLKTLKGLAGKEVQVGVFGGGEITMIASVHEFGISINVTPKMRGWFAYNGYPLKKTTTQIVIPERSFLRSGYDENKQKIMNKIEQLLPDVLERGVNPQGFMDAIGLEFVGMIQKKLRSLKSPTNSSMTKERKGSSNPLIDTGRLVSSIRHEVK